VDATVRDQAFERQPGDLATHSVEARKRHGRRGLVDDDVHAGELLQRADVASVATDDAPLHLVAGKLDEPGRGLARVLGRKALHRDGEDVAGATLGIAGGLLLDLLDPQAGLVSRLLLDLGDQHLLRLRGAEAR
jgi:hypothetical protein